MLRPTNEALKVSLGTGCCLMWVLAASRQSCLGPCCVHAVCISCNEDSLWFLADGSTVFACDCILWLCCGLLTSSNPE